ncbi:MAG TPA: right-handed parallel beta-helix repeat-containing protein [Rhodoblastus sp.]|nr:right-handed parallel beta-helix repeat-containing protein [Rhodoblastus sp.]
MGYTAYPDKILYAATGGTGTLQDAINQAQTTKLPLFIAPGNYTTGNLVISAPVRIYATPGMVMLNPLSSTNGFTIDIRSNTPGARISDVTLEGLSFYGGFLPFATQVDTGARYVYGQFIRALGNAAATNFNAIISAYNVDKLRIERCRVSYSGCCGIAVWGSKALIRDCEVHNNRIAAIYSADNYSTEILDNFIHDNDNNSIVVMRSTIGFDGTIVRGNQVAQTSADFGVQSGQVAGSGWYGNGLCALNASDILVTQNVFLNSTFSGVRLDSCFNAQVANNQIYNCGETALMWECPVSSPSGTPGDQNPYRYEGGVVANNVIVNAGVGISVTNGWNGGRRVTITGNHVKTVTRNTITTNDPSYPQYQTTGAGISGESDCVVSGNIVEDCASGPGIVLSPGAASNGSTRKSVDIAVGNTVKGSQIGIAYYHSALGYSLIASNAVEGSSGGAIVAVTLPAPYYSYTRVPGSTDYGTTAGGLYSGKPTANLMIGLNFAM